MMRSLFSLLFLVCFLPSAVLAQDQSELINSWLEEIRTNPSTENVQNNQALIDAFTNPTSDSRFNTLGPEDLEILTRRARESASDYIARINGVNRIRVQQGLSPLPDPTQSTTQVPPNNGVIQPPLSGPRPPIDRPEDTLPITKSSSPVSAGNNTLDQIVNPSIFGGQPLNRLFNQIFYIGLVAAVILAIVMIIRGGVEYMTIDAIASKENGKKRVQAALGGLVLAFSAILILNTINPGLTSLEINFKSIKKIQGIQVEVLGITPGGDEIVRGQDGSIYVASNGGLANTNSLIKGDFSSVTAADIRQHLGQNYTDADVQAFIDAGRQHNIDPRFLASISKFETGNGTSKAFTDGRNNAMGTSNSKGPIGFNSVRESIFAQANSLSRQGGYYENANTIQQIGNIYSPAVNPKTGKPYENDINGTNWSWAGSVTANYDKMTKGDARTTTTLP
jgi:hypothetical protein